MAKKQKYRIRNGKDYNKALINRGSLTVWFDPNCIDSWYTTARTGQRGRPQYYSDLAIQYCLTLKEALPNILEQIDAPINQVTGDGAYDSHGSYQSTLQKNAIPCFPPRKNARLHKPIDEDGDLEIMRYLKLGKMS